MPAGRFSATLRLAQRAVIDQSLARQDYEHALIREALAAHAAALDATGDPANIIRARRAELIAREYR